MDEEAPITDDLFRRYVLKHLYEIRRFLNAIFLALIAILAALVFDWKLELPSF